MYGWNPDTKKNSDNDYFWKLLLIHIIFKKKKQMVWLDVVAYTCNYSTQEIGAGGSLFPY